MIYVGTFTFATLENEQHGYFTLVVEAEDVDDTEESFKALLKRLRKNYDMFDDIPEVDCVGITEFKTVPPVGAMVHFEKWDHSLGEVSLSACTSVLEAADDEVAAYEMERDEDGSVEPFLVFDQDEE